MLNQGETKEVVTIISDPTPGTSIAAILPYVQTNTCNVYSLTEPMDVISQGTGQGDRIGNRLYAKTLRFKGYIYSIPTEGISGFPTNVTMYIGRLKQSVLPPTAYHFQNLFQLGDTTKQPTDDNRSSLYAINTDLWTVHYRRTFKVGSSWSDSPNAVPNNDYKSLVKFNINCTPWIPKHIRYNDGSAGSINVGLYVWFTIANYNDFAIGVGYSPQVQFCSLCEFTYTDS